MHGYLTRDGISPDEFLKIGREELARYETVEILFEEVIDAEKDDSGFIVHFTNRPSVKSRKLVLATGVVDELPQVAGTKELSC
jgi:thioredoxin reductase